MSDARTDDTRILSGTPTLVGANGVAAAVIKPPVIPDVIIEAELGRGGMGVVYKGRQGYINRPVAVKLLLHTGAGDNSEYVKRFQREATLLAGLNHPHIVSCYQAGVTPDNHCYLVMEYLDGPNLQQYVRKHGPLAENDALQVVKSIATALEYARAQGIIHRDVKAENILLAPSGAGGSFPYIAKLVDLGLARPTQPTGDMSLTRQGMLLGTPATMAPEQFDDPEGVDHRADIYGLGCAFFQAVTGKAAYSGASLAQIVATKVNGDIPDPRKSRSGISDSTSEIIVWMLAKQREARPQSYGDLIARIGRALGGIGSVTRKRSFTPLLVGVAVVVALSLGVVVLINNRKTTEAASAPVTAPAPVATPTASPAATPKAVSFAAPLALYGNDLRTALDEWITVPGWGLAIDGDDLIGHSDSTARITRPIPASPWRITGIIANPEGAKPFQEAGLRIEMSDTSALAITVKDLTAKHYAVCTDIAANGTAAPPREFKELPVGQEGWQIEITSQGGNLSVTVGGVAFNPIRLGVEPTWLSLTVKKGAVAIRKLTIATAQ